MKERDAAGNGRGFPNHCGRATERLLWCSLHKSTSGVGTQLQSMMNGGWIVTASWPIDTERVAGRNKL